MTSWFLSNEIILEVFSNRQLFPKGRNRDIGLLKILLKREVD
jgi:hypothetical protein